MSESGKPSTPPVWPQLMRLDKAATKPPPSWQEWKKLYGFWDWVLWPEWASEWIVHWSRNWDVVKALELAGKFTVLITVVWWLLEAGDRKKAKHYRAWERINSARGSTGDGGRRYALQDLNEDRVSLAATPLSQAYLVEVKLLGADLREATLSGAYLIQANLSGAIVGILPLERPLEWLPSDWEVFDDKGIARLRRRGVPPAPPQ